MQESPRPAAVLDTLRAKTVSGELLYRLSEPPEIEGVLGAPERSSEERQGGMLRLTWYYPHVTVTFVKTQDDPAPFVLGSLEIDGLPLDCGADGELRLRTETDLAKLDRFDGFQNVALDRLDLRPYRELLVTMRFDSSTVWPPPSRMPEGFDPQRLLSEGLTPGLGVRTIHERGIDGRGLGLAIIDQPLLLGHREYTNRIVRYDATGLSGSRPQMHGSPVASIAVGKRLGVAPGAELSYYAVPMWEQDNRPFAAALNAIVELNGRLGEAQRVRVVSVSTGMFGRWPHREAWEAALARAEAGGIAVVTCDPAQWHCQMASWIPGRSREEADGYSCSYRAKRDDELLVPGGMRVLASHTGADVYWFDPLGGMSWCAPYLAGLMALGFQVNPGLTPPRARSLLQETATRIGSGLLLDPVSFVERAQAG